MSNVVGRGLGQPGEGALVAYGLGIGVRVAGDLEADCVATSAITCDIDAGQGQPVRPPGGAQTPRLVVLDLEGHCVAQASMQADLAATYDLDGEAGNIGSVVTAPIDVEVSIEAVVQASAQAAGSQVRHQAEAELVALLL